jgi:NAD(P)-dependent dehydrogenase (short-subunit alcohol dehydrogenase family)
VTSLIRTLAIELAPVRFNALHPGIVGDSPFWEGKPLDAVIDRTPTGRLVTMHEVEDATVFLLENGGMNGVNLPIDGGWLLS